MQHDILLIIGAACTALVFIQSGIPWNIKRRLKLRRLKPFDCELCLAFWLGVFSSIYFEKNVPEVIYIGAIAAIMAVFINKKLNA
jgi:hypothetical protein